jgi:hypothetical protein
VIRVCRAHYSLELEDCMCHDGERLIIVEGDGCSQCQYDEVASEEKSIMELMSGLCDIERL